MATLSTIKLSKSPGTSWGFRLQGGKDFATPLCIQKVNVGSVAAQAGLQAGDVIVTIAGVDAFTLRHKEAQDTIVRAGNSFDVVIQRGSQVWKPTITALPEVKTLSDGVPVATKTSLAATQKPFKPIGSRHNVSAAPFNEGLVLPAYNTPINIYSDDSIAETLSAQAEVLGKTGVMGINFKKYAREEKIRTDSPTYKLLHGDEEPERRSRPPLLPVNDDDDGQQATPPAQGYPSGVSAVSAPVTNSAGPQEQLRPGENTCFVCERLVVGVFVRVKGKNLHAECFKCSTCGSSLKNVGYYNINDKLYCDTHAKQAARVNPPAPNMEPVIVPPGSSAPFGAVTAQQAGRMKVPSAFQQNAAPAPSHAPVPAPFKAPPPGGVRILPVQTTNAPTPFKRAPVSAPAPPKSFAPAPAPAPAPVPVAAAPRPAPSFGTGANPQGFGAPARDVNVRSHIPKKGDVPAPMSFASAPAPAPAPFAPVSAPVYAPAPVAPVSMPIKPAPPGLGGPGPIRGVLQAPGHRTAPRRGRGIMNQASGSRIPVCSMCSRQIRGPFVSALGKTWCPDHFICATTTCKRNIIDMGFVEEKGGLYCENCYESFMAPICGKCDKRIKGDCLNAVGKQFHPECFCCAYCGRVFGSGAFYLEDGLPYCETDWNDLFTTKCVGCNFPIEAGDRWVEALNNNYHSQCFKCSKCHQNLEGQSFFAKGGKPFCKTHAQRGIL